MRRYIKRILFTLFISAVHIGMLLLLAYIFKSDMAAMLAGSIVAMWYCDPEKYIK